MPEHDAERGDASQRVKGVKVPRKFPRHGILHFHSGMWSRSVCLLYSAVRHLCRALSKLPPSDGRDWKIKVEGQKADFGFQNSDSQASHRIWLVQEREISNAGKPFNAQRPTPNAQLPRKEGQPGNTSIMENDGCSFGILPLGVGRWALDVGRWMSGVEARRNS